MKKVYIIEVETHYHPDTYAYYSTYELAEEALKELLRSMPKVQHSNYMIREVYLDTVLLPTKETK